MYIKINIREGETREEFEKRKQRIKSFLEMGCDTKDYEEPEGSFEEFCKDEAPFRVNAYLKRQNIYNISEKDYNNLVESVACKYIRASILDFDHMDDIVSGIVDGYKFEVEEV